MACSRSSALLHTAISAMITAIETYNKPDHKYREETFSILALNAWELLLKAKVLKEKDNDIRELYIYERRTLKNGTKSKRRYIKRNRTGNPMTISMGKTLVLIENEGLGNIDQAVKANLDALTEIRDNSIHLINMSSDLSKAIQELGTATLQNFVKLTKKWFDHDLSQYNFYLMPLAFFRDFDSALAVNLTSEETNIAKYLTSLHHSYDKGGKNEDEYAVTLELNVRLKRSALSTAARLALGDDPDAIPVTLTEEDIRSLYPWDYKELTERLQDSRSIILFEKNLRKINDM
ncbi:DUF3644 domain-containing protein [Halothermothrix orenii]|uniref:DUF3644 domain-containing protein n=1 Tax=Halothermothrix orenii (strain H 168 / OCM 544 / DSM 9562) TaxID=373903 RepID=B8D035_HALOH|nr:DUF3644 domain-containing protein [Halothermothrix orenii]ACL68789.1 hypothetical protein Hore_00260 [Halothermothrix orenii H 168]